MLYSHLEPRLTSASVLAWLQYSRGRCRSRQENPDGNCPEFRIDIGVVHPSEPGRYLLGVECDGATYHSLPTARDRDRLRQLVLEELGWKLHRVWSTDWWTDPEREMQKLEAAINKRLPVATQ